jgi:hypothetical protein
LVSIPKRDHHEQETIMSTKLLTLAVVALTFAACGTESETAVAFFPTGAKPADFQRTETAYAVVALCAGKTQTTLSCTSEYGQHLGDLELAPELQIEPDLLDEPTPIATQLPEDLENEFIEIACRLCAEYRGRPSAACTVCESDDDPEQQRPEI